MKNLTDPIEKTSSGIITPNCSPCSGGMYEEPIDCLGDCLGGCYQICAGCNSNCDETCKDDCFSFCGGFIFLK
jgi:hypothetical protein